MVWGTHSGTWPARAPSESAFLLCGQPQRIYPPLSRFIFLRHTELLVPFYFSQVTGVLLVTFLHILSAASSVDYRHPTSRSYTSPIRVSACTFQTLEHTITSASSLLHSPYNNLRAYGHRCASLLDSVEQQ